MRWVDAGHASIQLIARRSTRLTKNPGSWDTWTLKVVAGDRMLETMKLRDIWYNAVIVTVDSKAVATMRTCVRRVAGSRRLGFPSKQHELRNHEYDNAVFGPHLQMERTRKYDAMLFECLRFKSKKRQAQLRARWIEHVLAPYSFRGSMTECHWVYYVSYQDVDVRETSFYVQRLTDCVCDTQHDGC